MNDDHTARRNGVYLGREAGPTRVDGDTVRPPRLALHAAAFFWLGRATCDALASPVPRQVHELPAWVATHRVALIAGNELLFFTALALGVLALELRGVLAPHRGMANLAAVALGTAAVLLVNLAVVEGRLVYPMLGWLARDGDAIGLVLAVTHGGLHAAGLLFAVAQAAVALAAWREGLRGLAGLSLGLALASVLGTFPDQLGVAVTWAGKAAFSAWLVVLGQSGGRRTDTSARPTPAPAGYPPGTDRATCP